MASSPDPSSRLLQAVEALRAEADELQAEFNQLYPRMVQNGRFTALLGLSNRIGLLRHIADTIAAL